LSKVFKYELKRLLLNKFFFALLIISVLYSYQILSGDIIVGIAYTAPFSGWSYGMYLANVMPLLLVTLLFFITFLYSNQEKQVKQLTFATPVNPLRYALVRCLAMVAGYLIISLFVIILSLIFYGVIFGFYGFTDFIVPILITLLPGMLFIFGVGLFAGSVQSNLLYALMILVLLIGFLPLPAFADLFGGHLFSTYPLKLPVGLDGEPIYSLPISFLLGRIFYSVTGAILMFYGIKRYTKA
jgi:ABC-2 type transport system permease protein